MKIEKMIEAVRLCGSTPKVDQCKQCAYWSGGDMSKCIPRMTTDAATALSTLHGENEKLRAELKKMKRERDAAIKDIWVSKWTSCKYGKGCTFTSARTGFPDCAGCGDWEWRGIKED